MDTLVSVLLFLNVISPSGHYTSDDINMLASAYAQQIDLVESIPGLLETILDEEEPLAIVVIDDLGA